MQPRRSSSRSEALAPFDCYGATWPAQGAGQMVSDGLISAVLARCLTWGALGAIMKYAAALAALAIGQSAFAGPVLYPVQVGQETARFDRGQPTVTLTLAHGAIQLRPRPMDHGSVAFDIAVFNDGTAPANFDIVNVEATANGIVLRPFSLVELEKKAKNRAMWSQIGVALVAGAAAYSAASMRDTYRSTLYTPHGVYRGYYRSPSAAGQVLAAGAIAGGVVASVSIEEQLRRTLDGMQDNIVQVTTIDPGDSYAGMIVLQKVAKPKLPQRVDLRINWNGEVYPFALLVAKEGTPMPEFKAITPPAPMASPAPPTPAPAVAPTPG